MISNTEKIDINGLSIFTTNLQHRFLIKIKKNLNKKINNDQIKYFFSFLNNC